MAQPTAEQQRLWDIAQDAVGRLALAQLPKWLPKDTLDEIIDRLFLDEDALDAFIDGFTEAG